MYKFVKLGQLALPLHAEFRTLPRLVYVPPMLPAQAIGHDGRLDASHGNTEPAGYFGALIFSRS